MMPNGLNSVLANQKMDDQLAHASRETLRRSVASRSRHGILRLMRWAIGDALIFAGRRMQGSIADRASHAAPVGTRL